jgi:hypothetical protein
MRKKVSMKGTGSGGSDGSEVLVDQSPLKVVM